MTDVVIVSAVRTAIGRLGGALKDVQPEATRTPSTSTAAPSPSDPLGCSGARNLTTLLHEMRKRGTRSGLAGVCIAGGQGMATIIETPGSREARPTRPR